ncbi:MAG: hypothetical protein P1Q69_21470, partial [Candidatus Thorarchaeota archaeon]|nr:hypothetical protein [Candidatus Thorarchaeota archaeon]
KQAFNTPYTISGTRAPWPVNPGDHGKKLVEIIIIKTLVQTGSAVEVNMTVSPVAHVTPIGPEPLLPNSTYHWVLPPMFGNYTDPADGNWSRWWMWNYNDDRFSYILEINVTGYMIDSFFDVFIEFDNTPIMQYLNISRTTPLMIEFDPMMDFGEYYIRISQSGWSSVGSGELILRSAQREGAFIDTPVWHTYTGIDSLDLPIPFTRVSTGALYINVTMNIGEDAQFFFNASEAVNAMIWNGVDWLTFNYDIATDTYRVDLHSYTDVICIEVLAASTDVLLHFVWSESLTG